MTKVTTSLDAKKIEARIETKAKKITPQLASMVLSDSNYFVPVKTSVLEKSAITNSRINEGVLIWSTPYARAQYYGEDFDHSQQHNPSACAKWYEAAKARWLDKWVRFTNELFKRS